ncbi:hypothetical protein FRB97_001234 [Tulasnella sp. 331]|nr:hypothetical protein FRB97_001234 [Tulasnella sp. 331]
MKSTALAFLSILSTSLVSAGPTPLNQEKRTSLSSIFGEIIAELSGSGSSTTSSQCPSNEFAWTFLGDPLPFQWDSDIVPSDRWSLVVHGYGSFWDIMSLQLLLAFNVPVLRSCYRDHIILTVVQQQLVLNHAVFPMVGHQRPPRPEHRAPAIGTGIPPWLAAPPKRLKQAPAPPLAPTTSSGGLPHQAVYQAEEQPQAHVPPARHVPPPGTGTRATAAAFPKTREAILYPHARSTTSSTTTRHSSTTTTSTTTSHSSTTTTSSHATTTTPCPSNQVVHKRAADALVRAHPMRSNCPEDLQECPIPGSIETEWSAALLFLPSSVDADGILSDGFPALTLET